MRIFTAVGSIGVCTLLLFAAGCNRPPQAVYPVRGVVQWGNGQAATELAQATVELQVVSGPEIRVSPRGEVQPDGTFVLKTYSPADGAPAGKYKAIVMPKQSFDDERRQVSVMDPRFQNYTTSPLTVEVKTSDNDVKLLVERLAR